MGSLGAPVVFSLLLGTAGAPPGASSFALFPAPVMASVPTRTVKIKGSGVECVINASDFDPAVHLDPSAPKPAPKKTTRKRKPKAG